MGDKFPKKRRLFTLHKVETCGRVSVQIHRFFAMNMVSGIYFIILLCFILRILI